jgi:hypothetical protein
MFPMQDEEDLFRVYMEKRRSLAATMDYFLHLMHGTEACSFLLLLLSPNFVIDLFLFLFSILF